MKSDSKDKFILCIFFLLVLAGLSVFFCSFHSQVVLDYDDWSYISGFRLPLPLPNYWNPSRILPECLMPLCGFAGSCLYHLFPALGYIWSISLVVNIVLSLFIVQYLLFFALLFRKRFSLPTVSVCLLTVFFLFLHFLVFLSLRETSPFMFMTTNMTCCFFYLIPALVNSSLVLILLSNHDFPLFFVQICRKKVLFLVFAYFCIFSNLFGNIILASYLVSSLLFRFFTEKVSFSAFCRRYSLLLCLLSGWVLSVLLESVGGRARLASGGMSALQDLSSLVFPDLSGVLNQVSGIMIGFLCLSVLVLLILLIRKQTSLSHIFLLAFSGLVCLVMVCLLCAKVDPSYIFRTEVLFGPVFFLLLVLALLLAALIRSFPGKPVPTILLATLSVIEICCCLNPLVSFADSFSASATPENCVALSQHVVDQVTCADSQNQQHVIVHVAKSQRDQNNNWPQTYYLGDALSDTLLRHRIIKNTITIDIYADEELNRKYDIYFY